MGDAQVERLWVRIKGQSSQGDIVAVFYRSPDQEEEMDEVLQRWLEASSKSQEVVFVGDFNYPDMC